MWFVFDATSGALVSSGSRAAPADELAKRGLAAIEVQARALPETWRWNAAARAPEAYVPPPPPPTQDDKLDALAAEIAAIRTQIARLVAKTGA